MGDSSAGALADGAAPLADKEDDEIVAGVIMHTGDERVAALDPVHEPILAQKIEGAIDRNGGKAAVVLLSEPLDDLISAERVVALEQRLQHLTADWSEPLRARRALGLGVRDGRAGATVVVVVRRRKDCARHFSFLVRPSSAYQRA